ADRARRHPLRAGVGGREQAALRDPHRQRELRGGLRGLLPRRPAQPGRRRGDAGGPARVRGVGEPRAPPAAPCHPSRLPALPPPPPPPSPWAGSTTRTGWYARATTGTTRATAPRWTACRSRR